MDFQIVRERVSMADVLQWLDFVPSRRRGDPLRGPCPRHGSRGPQSRSLSVHLTTGRYPCFGCGSFGNQLELWAAAREISVYAAAVELCQRLGREVPWIQRW